MQGISRQLLSILLSALLVLAPWGALSASSGEPLGDTSMHAVHLSDAASLGDELIQASCEHGAGDCCSQLNCSSASCGGCVSVLAIAYASAALCSDGDYVALNTLATPPLALGSLFRPPRL